MSLSAIQSNHNQGIENSMYSIIIIIVNTLGPVFYYSEVQFVLFGSLKIVPNNREGGCFFLDYVERVRSLREVPHNNRQLFYF